MASQKKVVSVSPPELRDLLRPYKVTMAYSRAQRSATVSYGEPPSTIVFEDMDPFGARVRAITLGLTRVGSNMWSKQCPKVVLRKSSDQASVMAQMWIEPFVAAFPDQCSVILEEGSLVLTIDGTPHDLHSYDVTAVGLEIERLLGEYRCLLPPPGEDDPDDPWDRFWRNLIKGPGA